MNFVACGLACTEHGEHRVRGTSVASSGLGIHEGLTVASLRPELVTEVSRARGVAALFVLIAYT